MVYKFLVDEGGLVFKAHRLLYHSTLGSRLAEKKSDKFQPPMVGGRAKEAGDVLHGFRQENLIRDLGVFYPFIMTRVLWFTNSYWMKTQPPLVQGYLAHKKQPTPRDHHGSLDIGLL